MLLPALVVALLSAALMGMAIQRGATCMVAAVDEAIVERRFGRAGALAEAAVWVGGLVGIAQLIGLLGETHPRFPTGGWTVAGGALLGLGAWVNRACVFGSIARIGSGQWAWLASPIGFFAGSLLAVDAPSAGEPPSLAVPAVVSAPLFVVLLLWRIGGAARAPDVLSHLWHPHRATLLIGITFVTTMLAVGAWAYTDALAALAQPGTAMDPRLALRGAMVAALLGGAIVGGWLAGTLRSRRPDIGTLLRCFLGGALMGVGAMLVPGSNDGLIMLGLPLLLPHAWIAVTAMTLTIAAAIGLSRLRLQRKNGSLAA